MEAAASAAAAAARQLPPRKKARILGEGNQIMPEKFQKFLDVIVELDAQTDGGENGETYLDLKKVGFVSDKNKIAPLRSRERLWEQYPELKGRLVVFPFHEKLFNLTKEALNERRPVCITGTPGVGKSVLRTLHAHSFLRQARTKHESCRIILGKGGQENCFVLTLLSNGDTSVEMGTASKELNSYDAVGDPSSSEEEDEEGNEADDKFVLGLNCFVLVDVSNGMLGSYDEAEAGLVVYSSPNNSLIEHQAFKANGCLLAYPMLDKEILLRYKNDEMEQLYEKYGGLARLVWGSKSEEERHLDRLKDSLQDVEAFLRTASTENYLVGPHRFYYTEVNKDENGDWIHSVSKSRPGVVPAPKHVMRIAAKKVVAHLLAPSVKASFGLDHKTVSGVLFEEVSLILLTEYRESITIKVRPLNKSRRLGYAKLVDKNNVLLLETDLTRKDVASASLPDEVEGSTGGDLVVPQTPNFPGLDAVLVLASSKTDMDFWIYLQMTTTLIHAVADGGVDMLVTLSNKAPRKKPRTKKQEGLAFVVPDNLFKTFEEQKAKSDGKQASLDGIPQYVMSISIRK